MSDPIRVQVKRGNEVIVEMEADSFRHDLLGDAHVLVVIKAERPPAEQMRMLDHINRVVRSFFDWVPGADPRGRGR